jgi:hypothetical protein
MEENQKSFDIDYDEMSTQDIVQKSMARTHPGEDWEEIYAYMYHGLQSPHFRMIRRRNSLLFFQVDPPEARNVHLFTADDQEEVKVSLQEFFKVFKIAGYKKVTGEVENPAILRLMRMSGLKVKESKLSDGYIFEVEIK